MGTVRFAVGEERLSSQQQQPLCPSPLAPGPTRGAGLLALEGAKAVSGEGWAGGHPGGLPAWQGHAVPSGGPAPSPRGHLELRQGLAQGPGLLRGCGRAGLCVRAWACPRSALSWVGSSARGRRSGSDCARPSPRVFTGNLIPLEEPHIKARWRLMSRGLGGQQAGGSVPVCDLWSHWHQVPGEDCDRSSLWHSGVSCFPEAGGHWSLVCLRSGGPSSPWRRLSVPHFL